MIIKLISSSLVSEYQAKCAYLKIGYDWISEIWSNNRVREREGSITVT